MPIASDLDKVNFELATKLRLLFAWIKYRKLTLTCRPLRVEIFAQ
jgi:hypothetical protein